MSTAIVALVNCPPELAGAVRAALLRAGLLPADNLGLDADLLVVWSTPETVVAEVAGLRDQARPHMPAVVAVGVAPAADHGTALARGADLCLAEAEPQALARHCAQLAATRQRFLQTSPLTGLPGNETLAREIARRFAAPGTLAVLAFDLDHFKGYNDFYGYERGDEFLRWVATVLTRAVAANARPGWLLGHLGGDDFLALVHPAEARAVAERALELFEAERATRYEPVDLRAGGIRTRNRLGEQVWHPLVTLTVAQAGNEAPDITHAGQLAADQAL